MCAFSSKEDSGCPVRRTMGVDVTRAKGRAKCRLYIRHVTVRPFQEGRVILLISSSEMGTLLYYSVAEARKLNTEVNSGGGRRKVALKAVDGAPPSDSLMICILLRSSRTLLKADRPAAV